VPPPPGAPPLVPEDPPPLDDGDPPLLDDGDPPPLPPELARPPEPALPPGSELSDEAGVQADPRTTNAMKAR
jgi:hypothetical protein